MSSRPGSRSLLIGSVVIVLAAVTFTLLPIRPQGRIVEVLTLGTWPLEWAARRHFDAKQAELQLILDFLNEAPEVGRLSVSVAGLRASLAQSETEFHALDEPNILDALVSVDARHVTAEDDRVYVFMGSEARGSLDFEISYPYSAGGREMPDCGRVDPGADAEIGRCAFALSPEWALRYQWYPGDTEDLQRALDELDQ